MPKRKKHQQVSKAPTENRSQAGLTLAVLGGILFVVTLFAYIPVFTAGYVEFDDQIYIRENLRVSTGFTWENIVWAFTEIGFASNWHPLTWMSHMLDAELFGVQPQGHHVVNVLIHGANAVLLFLTIRAMTGQTFASFVVAGLFALHPINVESVAWLAQRKNTLSTFFGILSIWAYARYTRQRDWRSYAASLLLFALSLLAKPMLVTLPFGLLLLDFWPLQRSEFTKEPHSKSISLWQIARGLIRSIPDKLPYFAMSIGVIVLTLMAQKTAINPLDKYPLSERLSNVSVSYVEYLWLMIWPVKLAVFYPLYAADITLFQLIGSIVFLLCITLICYLLRGRQPYLLVGWLWYLGTMIPVIGIVHVGAQSLADRYAYVPFWGLWIILVWLAKDGLFYLNFRARTLWIPFGISVALLVVLGGLTFRQSSRWSDTVSLFESAVENTPKNWLAHKILANHYLVAEDYEKAIWHCEQTRSWGREYPMIYSTHGRALYGRGQREAGLQLLKQAIQWYPEVALYRANLGWTYVDMGQYKEAIEQLEAANRLLTPEDTVYARRIVHANWGIALAQLGAYSAGLEKFELALSREPDNAELLRAAAQIDLQLKHYERSRERLVQVLRNNSADVAAYELLARSFTLEENWKEAAAVYQTLIHGIPQHYDARLNLSDLLIKMQQHEAARQQLQSLDRELSVHNETKVKFFLSQVHSKLAITYAAIDDLKNARQSAKLALEFAQHAQDQALIDQANLQLDLYKDN